MPANRALDTSLLQDAAVLVACLHAKGERKTVIVRALCDTAGISPATAYRWLRRPDFLALVREAHVAGAVIVEPVGELVPEPVVQRDDRSGVELAAAALETAQLRDDVDAVQERDGAAPSNPPKTIAGAAEESRSSRRVVDGVPLWGDSDAWPRTDQDHAERDAYYESRRLDSEEDFIDYNTVLRGGQPPEERLAASRERLRSRRS